MLKTKECAGCKENLPATDDYFYRRGSGSKTLFSECKSCNLARSRNRRNNNLEQIRAVEKSRDNNRRSNPEQLEKKRKYNREWRKRNPLRAPQKPNKLGDACRGLRRSYGITLEDHGKMLDDQGGCCAICRSTENYSSKKTRLSVDHCHTTKAIRGLLCNRCNMALGMMKDNTETLLAAVAYLKDPPYPRFTNAQR